MGKKVINLLRRAEVEAKSVFGYFIRSFDMGGINYFTKSINVRSMVDSFSVVNDYCLMSGNSRGRIT